MLAVATSILLLATRATRATKSLGLSLSGPTSVNNVDDLIVVATFTNTGDEPLKLYQDPATALSPFPEDKCTISTSDSTVPAFIGAHAMYTFEAATDFVELTPGATAEIHHQISAAYKFTVNGEYTVNVANTFTYQDDNSEAPVSINADVSGSYSVKVQGNLVSSIVSKRTMSLAKRTTYDSCNGYRTSLIDEAITNAMKYLSNVVAYLNPLTKGQSRYVLWWGTYTDDRKNSVLGIYTKIISSDPRSYTYYCACDHDFVAFVYLNELGHIYLCKQYWKLPAVGNDSKGGAIIHEASHFTANGGTGDYARGAAQSKALASNNPSTAIMNADNYEYFAETMWGTA